MGITKIEKFIIGAMAVLMISIAIGAAYTIKAVIDAGGVKAVIIETGKEIKDVTNQITED